MSELKPCPYCKSTEVFYGEYDTFSDTTFGGYKIRCRCGYAYRKSVWCDSANEAIEAWNRRADNMGSGCTAITMILATYVPSVIGIAK